MQAHRPSTESVTEPLLVPGRNCWRLGRADRLALLVDGAAYFRAFRLAAARARRSILLVGWDVSSTLDLSRDAADDGLPAQLGAFLDALTRRAPRLHVYVLDWDFVMLYAFDREFLPRLQFGMLRNPRIHFWLDSRHPVAGSHHQKMVVIDDSVAFVGGMDLAASRWDTPAHEPGDPRRVNPDGTAYPPVHDVQCMVDGAPAAAVGELARRRWLRATGGSGRVRPRHPAGDAWPEEIAPDFRDVDVAISRTSPAYDGEPEVREIEALYLDSIAAARRSIYIENQYFTASRIGDALAARLEEPDGPEVVLVSRASGGGWLEEGTMKVLRAHLLERLRQHDPHGRLGVYYPHHEALQEQWINLHSKLMIVDDRLVRVGSANLNNRSMGYDTECDLALEARSAGERARVLAIRDRLLGEHLGVAPEQVGAEAARHGSLLRAIERLRGKPHTLVPLPPGLDPDVTPLVTDGAWIDPETPVDPEALVAQLIPPRQRPSAGRRIAAGIGLLIVMSALAAAWRWGPLSEWVNLANLERAVDRMEGMPLTPLWVLGAFVLAAVLAVPITVLIFGTALVFGPFAAFGYALAGSVAGAALTFGLGRVLGQETVRRLAGGRINALSRRFARRGVLAVAALRVIPVAPFAVVNLVAGASHLAFRDFVVGTVLGMTPGIGAIAVFSDRLLAALRLPSPATVATVVAILGAIALGVWSTSKWIMRREAGPARRRPAPGARLAQARTTLFAARRAGNDPQWQSPPGGD